MKAPRTRKATTGEKDVACWQQWRRSWYAASEFLLSMVETNGRAGTANARKMEVRLKAEQELARIEQQIEHLRGRGRPE